MFPRCEMTAELANYQEPSLRMNATGLLGLGEKLKEDLVAPTDAATFKALRTRARSLGGQATIVKELAAADFVKEGKLTTGTKPFNI